jgi:histidinol-phosphate aminotransferase
MSDLARDAVRALPLYSPDIADCAIDVSDNTNLWGTPPAALRALGDAPLSALTRYPSLYSAPLRDAILRYVKLDAASDVGVVTGCGSDDVLDATMRAFGTLGDRIALSVPTFSMIPTFARLNGMEPVAVPLMPTYDVDAERLVHIGAKITYLCSPNNPTATSLSAAAVAYVAEHASGVVLLDEAYAEFAPQTFVDLVSRYQRLIVTRTFSKAFGLAGLRVGYGVGSSEVVGMVERARGPYKVNALAERAVLAALEDTVDGLEWVRTHAALAVENRERLMAELRTLNMPPLPSSANFVFVPSARAVLLARRMRECGVLVRAFQGLPRDLAELARSNGEALRIGVGPWEIMEKVIGTLDEVLG